MIRNSLHLKFRSPGTLGTGVRPIECRVFVPTGHLNVFIVIPCCYSRQTLRFGCWRCDFLTGSVKKWSSIYECTINSLLGIQVILILRYDVWHRWWYQVILIMICRSLETYQIYVGIMDKLYLWPELGTACFTEGSLLFKSTNASLFRSKDVLWCCIGSVPLIMIEATVTAKIWWTDSQNPLSHAAIGTLKTYLNYKEICSGEEYLNNLVA